MERQFNISPGPYNDRLSSSSRTSSPQTVSNNNPKEDEQERRDDSFPKLQIPPQHTPNYWGYNNEDKLVIKNQLH